MSRNVSEKPRCECLYCGKDQGSKFALKRHKVHCRDNPANQRSNGYVVSR